MRFYVVLFCLVAFVHVSHSQTPDAPVGPQTLRQQYATLKSDLEVINGFRMVKLFEMDQFWKVIEDSLRTKRMAINQGLAIAKQQTAEIESLKAQVAKIEGDKQELTSHVANINVYGMSFSKGGFVTFISLLIVGLAVGCGVLFVISKVAYKSSRDLKKVNEDVYKEFEDYKHHAVEKQIKLSRELQNLKNRMSELKIA
jgi:hypothetical protein